MTPTVFTLTGNLLWEKTFEFNEWQPGKTQRARSVSFQVGGKGINASRMLMRLGVSTTALSFAGGATGAECLEWLRTQKLPCELFPLGAATRAGTVVRGGAAKETTFLGPDVAATTEGLRACARYLADRPPGNVLALCGSFPGWASSEAEVIRTAFLQWLPKGPLVADTYGPPLLWAVRHPLDLIKINRQEFDDLFSESERRSSLSERLQGALTRWPVKAWIVTNGAEDVWFCGGPTDLGRLSPPHVEEISPTGSGDVLFACVLHARYSLQASLRDAVAMALPYAAANAASPGVAEFDLNNLPGGRSLG